MSLESWKEEFYSDYPKNMTTFDAIKHSLKKWKGAKDKNLNKHCLVYLNTRVSGPGFLESAALRFDSNSCALCHLFLENNCRDCPIAIETGKPCDDVDSTWNASRNDPKPMIKLLKKLVKIQQGDL